MKIPSRKSAYWMACSAVVFWLTAGCAEDATFTAPNQEDASKRNGDTGSSDANAVAGPETNAGAAGHDHIGAAGTPDGVDTTGIRRQGQVQTGDVAGSPTGTASTGGVGGTSGG